MDRRYFLKSTAAAFALPVTRKMSLSTDTVYGHNGMQYKMDSKWGKADPLRTPVNDCHEMVQDRRGKIYLLTNETRNNVLRRPCASARRATALISTASPERTVCVGELRPAIWV